MGALLSLFSALGLSTAAGLNAYIPLLVVGLLARYTSLIQLSAPYDVLSNPWVLLGLALIALLDLIGDKIPGVDHALHLVGTVVHPVAGLVLGLATASGGQVDPTLAAICGLIAAGVTHGTRMIARPVATATTAGTANPVVSALEDIASLIMSLLAVLIPALAFLLLIVLAIAMVRVVRGVLRRRQTVRG
jgi:Domain of unknown function (DUF4126)